MVRQLVSSLLNGHYSTYSVLTFSATLVALVAYAIINFYSKLRKYPRGPLPLPIIGNLLSFATGGQICEVANGLRKKYGDVYTIWLGPQPNVLINSLEAANEVYRDKKDIFCNVNWDNIRQLIFGETGNDVLMANYGPTWEALRKVVHAAVIKYSTSERLSDIVADVVDETVKLMRKNVHGKKRTFDMSEYIYLVVYNVLSQSAYGQKYSPEDEEFVRLKNEGLELQELFPALVIVNFSPSLRPLFRSKINRFIGLVTRTRGVLEKKYKEHDATFQEGHVRNFCDALVMSKRESLLEQKDMSKYLTDENLSLTLLDLFFAGTQTTVATVNWVMLLMANYPDVQARARQELEDVAGEQQVTSDHKLRCHYLNALVAETLRFRPAIPLIMGHVAREDSTIAGMRVVKGTAVGFNQYALNHDPAHWEAPEDFRPERFLNSAGEFDSSQHKAFVAFGMGRRQCPGKAFALNNVFFIVSRLLQNTSGEVFALSGGPGSADLVADPSVQHELLAKRHEFLIETCK